MRLDLDAIEARASASNAGRWTIERRHTRIADHATDVPALVNAVRVMEARLRAQMAACHGWHDDDDDDPCIPCRNDRAALVAAGLEE